ncbi:hypothetical protein [Trichlorobacter lovleyi]|uniref:hypothetical protein n=1 Tax=Trichlorobacter lovleyi TaxID=313985 RepID=UPI002480CEF6|nr:hypothetical protein [Trichlorobacter lovleyi]
MNVSSIYAALLKTICFLVCLVIAAIVSFYAVFPVFGGHRSAWGLEYLLCLFAPLPAVIGFLISWFLLRHKYKGYERGILSALNGVAVAGVAIVLLCLVILYVGGKKDRDAAKFFYAAIQGKHSEVEIRNYYTNHPAPYQIKLDRTKVTISPKAMELLISVFDNNPSLKGEFSAWPETPTELKLKVAESPEIQAVFPMAINTSTPPEVLIKLASHELIEISRAVNNNSNAPLAARYIYCIRALVDEKERYVASKKLCPPDLEDATGKYVWESLASDKREYVRLWVAKSDAPPAILQSMGSDQSPEVLKWIFLNSLTPRETIKFIARQFNTNQYSLMERFSSDPDNLVRRAVTQTSATSDKLLFKLMADEDATVSGWASNELEGRGYDLNYSKNRPLSKSIPY